MRDRILSEIHRLATLNGGKPPGQVLFRRETGIGEHEWRGKFWARWGDALAEAGYQPNQWTERHNSDDLLAGVIAVCRHYGRLPTFAEIQMYRRNDLSLPGKNVIGTHFGGRSKLIEALAKRASESDEYADIAAMLPALAPTSPDTPSTSSKSPDGFVYLIKSGEFYKIGRSDDLERRVKEIRIAMPDKASLVHSIRTDDAPGIEAYWHRRFADKRANGEWFRLSSMDVSAFKKRKFQ